MAITEYSIDILKYEDVLIRLTTTEFAEVSRTWRNNHCFSNTCTKCEAKLKFEESNFKLCCQQFYYKDEKSSYHVKSIAVKTDKFVFQLPIMNRLFKKRGIKVNQEYIVFPDPIYWQISSTLVFDKIIKFISGLPITQKTKHVLSPDKATVFYKQLLECPLNHGSLALRSSGKNTFIRQYVFGKRCIFTMRGTISADSSLEPNQLRVPSKLDYLVGKHVLVNRMPSLQPENVIDLQVAKTWEYDCFGLPLEVLESLHADFDGDEINVWIFENIQSQAECMFLLNSKLEMGSKTIGLKLTPCQDMLVVFYVNFDKIDFLPYKDPNRNLKKTFRVIYDLYGSAKTYDCFNEMRKYYLHVMENEMVFSITLEEIQNLVKRATSCKSFEDFENNVKDGNLIIQIKSGAKGSLYHLYQMFKCVGPQYDGYVSSSFWKGLDPWEAVLHAKTSIDALLQSGKIWEPGYGYSKNVFNLQGLHVDYKGRLMDGKIMIDNDILNVTDSELILCNDAFSEILKSTLLNKNECERPTKKFKL